MKAKPPQISLHRYLENFAQEKAQIGYAGDRALSIIRKQLRGKTISIVGAWQTCTPFELKKKCILAKSWTCFFMEFEPRKIEDVRRSAQYQEDI